MRATAASITAALALAGISLAPRMASAHIGAQPASATADATSEISFAVGHGCEGADTLSITITIPAGVTSVRAVPNAVFPKLTVVRDAAKVITAITWEKDASQLAAEDENFYKLAIRAKLPNTPFATVYFPTKQVCQKKSDNAQIVADWASTAPSEGESGPKPAPAVLVLPARKPGWNKYTIPVAIAKPETVFGDAQIVWKGNAAYSANPATVEQIKATAGASVLTSFAAGDEVWVKY